jgi:hypothetical protein
MSTTKLTINKNGSIKIEGDFEITDCNGQTYGLEGRTALGLCRCGLSANKPFAMEHTAMVLSMNQQRLTCHRENSNIVF